MKRYGNLYVKIYDIDNLRLAHKNARKDKLFYKEVKMVDSDEDKYLIAIQEMLKDKTYHVSEYQVTTINDKGKERVLAKLPYYPDRIIQWAVMLQIEHIFMECFCDFTCASIKNRGIAHAQKLLRRYLEDVDGTKYCLKLDIYHFYPSIDHEILKGLLRKKFKDENLLWLLDMIIDSSPTPVGVPIGSYLSQFFANYYLAFFDHWLKEHSKCRYIVRYMDDIVVLSNSKEQLHRLRKDIDAYLQDNLKLSLKQNWQVFPVDSRGIDFVGYRQFHGYTLLRKRTAKRMKKKMLRIRRKVKDGSLMNYGEWCAVNSYRGWLIHADCARLDRKYIAPLERHAERYYKEVIQSDRNKER